MTDEQIENYRKVLFHIVGPYALIMSREEVIRYRDEMQSQFHKKEKEEL